MQAMQGVVGVELKAEQEGVRWSKKAKFCKPSLVNFISQELKFSKLLNFWLKSFVVSFSLVRENLRGLREN